MKRVNKAVLADRAQKRFGLELDPDTLFDCQVKRIHEYKRQLLNVAARRSPSTSGCATGGDAGVPRTVIFAARPRPATSMAKLIIRLIHAVAERGATRDPATRGRLARGLPPQLLASRWPS